MRKRSILIIVSILIIGLVIAGLYSTFAASNTVDVTDNGYNITLIEDDSQISVPAGGSKTVMYQITNTNKGTVQYGVSYTGDNIVVKVYEDSSDKVTGNIDYGENKFVKLYIKNTGTSDSTSSIQAVLGYEKGGSLDSVVPSGYTLVTEIYTPPQNLVAYIKNLYNKNKDEGDDTLVPNNGISYRYARIYDNDDDDTTSGGLMNDRLGTMSVSENSGNIRYYGSNPNNYIDIGDTYKGGFTINNWEKFGAPSQDVCYSTFDCSTKYSDLGFSSESSCNIGLPEILQSEFGVSTLDEVCGTITIEAGTPILYRVIGLFKDIKLADGTKKDLVKVVRNESIGNYSWDHSPSDVNSGLGINEWSQADLMKLLNPDHENEEVGGSLYWNSASGSCYRADNINGEATSRACDFTNSGLNSAVHNKIEKVYWNLGGYGTGEVFPNQIYECERGKNVYQIGSNSSYNDTINRTTVWPGKIALAYPSDFGYSADLNSCSETVLNYRNCNKSNWMYNTLTMNGVGHSWLLSPSSYNAPEAWYVYSVGRVSRSIYMCVSSAARVSPVFYLDSALGIVTGDGSEGNPYVVGWE